MPCINPFVTINNVALCIWWDPVAHLSGFEIGRRKFDAINNFNIANKSSGLNLRQANSFAHIARIASDFPCFTTSEDQVQPTLVYRQRKARDAVWCHGRAAVQRKRVDIMWCKGAWVARAQLAEL